MGSHINQDGRFQSDKFPTCPAGKVPLSTKDPTAQDLLWQYAQRRRAVDAEFADDLEACLLADGYNGGSPPNTVSSSRTRARRRMEDAQAADVLRLTMRNISEREYRVKWSLGLEFSLWASVANGQNVAPRTRFLREMSKLAGGWWRWDDDFGGHVFVPMDEWLAIYEAARP